MSLGALTTAFAPAASCVDAGSYWVDSPGFACGPDFDPYYVQRGPPWTQYPSCFPQGFIPVSTSYYSPGICPSSYTAACSSILIEGGQSVTAHVCCPNFARFQCPSPDATATWKTYPWFTTFGCWSFISATEVVTVTKVKPASNIVAVETYNAGIVGAYAINVRFKSGDFVSPLTQPGAPPVATPTQSITETQVLQSPSNLESPTNGVIAGNATGGVSTGTAAAIGVGSAAGTLLLSAGFWLLAQRLRKRATFDAKGTGGLTETAGTGSGPVELAHEGHNNVVRGELESSPDSYLPPR